MDELIDNVDDDKGEEDSEDRYNRLKKEEAGTGQTEAEKRFEELQEEAKKEFIRKQERRKEEEDEEDDSSNYVTY